MKTNLFWQQFCKDFSMQWDYFSGYTLPIASSLFLLVINAFFCPLEREFSGLFLLGDVTLSYFWKKSECSGYCLGLIVLDLATLSFQ